MQDKYSDIDLLMREMMSDAEVTPSRRVWKGVSSRVQQKQPVRFIPAGAWIGTALAAAALALGVFLHTPGDGNVTISSMHDGSMLAMLEGSPEISISLPEGTPAAITSAPLYRASAAPAVMAAEAEAEAEAEPAVEEDGREAAHSAAGTTAKKESSHDGGVWQDWEVYGQEGKRYNPGRFRNSFYAKGVVGGNESSVSHSRPHAMMAPGNGMTGFSETGASVYGVPFTLGAGVRFSVSPRLSIGTGLDYTLLTRTFSGRYTENSVIDEAGSVLHTLQYLGVPLNVYYDIMGSDRIKFYVYGGGEAEFCLSNKYTLFANPDIVRSYHVHDVQFSTGIGLGVEFLFSKRVGLYLDPGIRYYFPCNQPKSIRTDKPLLVNLDAGLRFNF